MNLEPLPAFSDNYIWMLHQGQRAVVVDPGDAAPVFDALKSKGLQLEAILVTHHHHDHTGGVAALREATGAKVFGPAHESIPEPAVHLIGGDQCEVLGLDFTVIDVPGHTAGHIAFWCAADPAPLLFCGDTLFSGGCGRLFEGTPAKMLRSLTVLADLPGNTRVCCGHEYTLSNLAFAEAIEPGNVDLSRHRAHCIRLREQLLPTLPSTIALERAINPFLRTDVASVADAARHHAAPATLDQVGVLATLRQWKNEFR
jgi:hydroxyacylglutathione hydrolase